MTQAEKFPDPF
ncbi:hypothetical protein ECFDA517_1945, partial [Escherichia coli FDA517]